MSNNAPPAQPSENEPARRAAVEIATRALATPGEITVLALGRMTNVALALRLAPEIANALAGVVVMGGAVRVPGNVSPVATANIHEDPEAAAILYDSGAPIIQVGLDVCDKCGFSEGQFERLRTSSSPAVQLLVSASAAAVDPSLMTMQRLPVAVDTGSDLTRGQTVVDWYGLTDREANADVCLEVDAERLTEMVVNRLVNHPWPA